MVDDTLSLMYPAEHFSQDSHNYFADLDLQQDFSTAPSYGEPDLMYPMYGSAHGQFFNPVGYHTAVGGYQYNLVEHTPMTPSPLLEPTTLMEPEPEPQQYVSLADVSSPIPPPQDLPRALTPTEILAPARPRRSARPARNTPRKPYLPSASPSEEELEEDESGSDGASDVYCPSNASSSAPSNHSVPSQGAPVSVDESLARGREPNMRIPPPIPVPNLTKKSRGRKVPTERRLRSMPTEATKERLYRCMADQCGKCFVRGEHLKRHVRSIHTHEKPHPCPYEGCNKSFSRRDNLGQHLRIHKT